MPTTNPTPGQGQQDQRQQQNQTRSPDANQERDRRNDPNRSRDDQNEDRIDMADKMETGGTDNRGTDIRGNQSARQGGQPAQAGQDQNRGGQKDR